MGQDAGGRAKRGGDFDPYPLLYSRVSKLANVSSRNSSFLVSDTSVFVFPSSLKQDTSNVYERILRQVNRSWEFLSASRHFLKTQKNIQMSWLWDSYLDN